MRTTGSAIGNTEANSPGRDPPSAARCAGEVPEAAGSTSTPFAKSGAATSAAVTGRMPSSSPNPMAVPRSSPSVSAMPSGPGVGGTSEWVATAPAQMAATNIG